MSLLLRDKLTTKPPPWKLNESISDAGQQPQASHTLTHRPSTQPVASGTTATPPQRPGSGLSAGGEESGLRPPLTPPLYLLVHTRVSLRVYSRGRSCVYELQQEDPCWGGGARSCPVVVNQAESDPPPKRPKRPKRPSAPSQPPQPGNNKEIYKFRVTLTVKLTLASATTTKRHFYSIKVF